MMDLSQIFQQFFLHTHTGYLSFLTCITKWGRKDRRKICWKGKILVVKTMYMGIGIQDIGGTKIVCIREMDMDG